jgi:hypothetical protein
MATHSGADAPRTEAPRGADAPKPKVEPAKLADDFQPNEPKPKTGVADDGQPDDSLGGSQAERAQTEALLSLRPQPSADEIKKVLENLAAKDEAGKVKKFKTAADAGKAAVDELNKIRAS